jgi:hypothetical protein
LKRALKKKKETPASTGIRPLKIKRVKGRGKWGPEGGAHVRGVGKARNAGARKRRERGEGKAHNKDEQDRTT